jgi:hypothetical protein
MMRVGLLSILAAAPWPCVLGAQSQAPNEGVQVGDHWTFDSRDDITGLPTGTFTTIVTDISLTEFVARRTTQGKGGFSITIYDHDWNVIETPDWRYKPKDGYGIRQPLVVGKEWRSEYEARSTQGSFANKETLISRVTAQETVVAPAGTFDAFKIERHRREVSGADPSKSWEWEDTWWYAPQINFWARRMWLKRDHKRVTERTSQELVAYGRKL